MNKRLLVIVIVILVGGAIVFGLITNNKTDNTAKNNTAVGSNAQSANTSNVSIQGFAFMPSDITVKKGTTVSWTNKDGTVHTVNETDGKTGPNSGDLNNGANYSFTYNQTGTFHYHCSIHPEMLGSVIVTE
jgi:plastocyanin